MRKLLKSDAPPLLAANHAAWTEEFIADPTNDTKRFRYRAPEIKAAVMLETADKCAYCECKIGHNSPGDIEHKVPTVRRQELHFEWSNLTCACSVCNTLKGDHPREGESFLDPYADDIESRVSHHGPVVAWRTGDSVSEFVVRKLKLNGMRPKLVTEKIVRLEALSNLLERIRVAQDANLKAVLEEQLAEMRGPTGEFSAMIDTFCRQMGAVGSRCDAPGIAPDFPSTPAPSTS